MKKKTYEFMNGTLKMWHQKSVFIRLALVQADTLKADKINR